MAGFNLKPPIQINYFVVRSRFKRWNGKDNPETYPYVTILQKLPILMMLTQKIVAKLAGISRLYSEFKLSNRI